MERRCARCKITKPSSDFSGPSTAYCHPCMATYTRERRAANPDPLRSRRDSLARYGLTFEQFDAMLNAQGGRCKICGSVEPGDVRAGPRGWHIDHDHGCCGGRKSCGRCIRGIVCSNCNRALGLLHEDAAVVQAMLDYLLAYRVRRDGHLPLLESR